MSAIDNLARVDGTTSDVLISTTRRLDELLDGEHGRTQMKMMIPTYDEDIKLVANSDRFYAVHQHANEILQLI